jgi:hypothetical protein
MTHICWVDDSTCVDMNSDDLAPKKLHENSIVIDSSNHFKTTCPS